MSRQEQGHNAFLTGRTFPTLVSFSVPIILGNMFQQLYSIVDAIVVGRFLGDLPLNGISIASPIMDILYALLLGCSIGVGVLVGQLYGAENWEKLRRVHATALLGGCALTLLLSALGFAFSRRILLAQGADAASVAQAMSYLAIILGGLLFCFLYNYFAAVLRASGNSRTPFVVLLVSSTLHALLDVALCGALHLGIYGVACSTVFCQIFSLVWFVWYIRKNCPQLCLARDELRVDRRLLGPIFDYVWAAALQQAVLMIGRFLIQGLLTPLGGTVVTGFNMSMRVEQFLFSFKTGFAEATAVGIAQNVGHGSKPRVRSFYRAGLASEAAGGFVLGTLVFFFAPQIIGLFSENAEVIAAGAQYARTISFFYTAAFFGDGMQAFFRGIGQLKLPMISSSSQILLRVLLSYLLIGQYGLAGVCAAVIPGWLLLVVIEGLYSLHVARTRFA